MDIALDTTVRIVTIVDLILDCSDMSCFLSASLLQTVSIHNHVCSIGMKI